MTNTQTPQWTVITAKGAKGCAADCLLIFIIYGDFYWNAQQQAKNRREKPDLWLLCENKTVLFLFAQHSYAAHWFDNQSCELMAQQAKARKVLKSQL